MKKFVIALTAMLFAGSICFAQDLITKKNGEAIQAKIIEVLPDAVKYKKPSYLDGPVFTILKSEILLIQYEDGTNEVVKIQPSYNNSDSEYKSSEEIIAQIQPGMKYKQLKKIYKDVDYNKYTGPTKYNPALMGFFSFLIPGLGQFIEGEVGRGFSYLIPSICIVPVTVGIGTFMIQDAFDPHYLLTAYHNYAEYNYAEYGVGIFLIVAGCAATLATDICAIVNAGRIAKVKNMYYNDLKQISFNCKLSPYADVLAMNMGHKIPIAGLSLKISF